MSQVATLNLVWKVPTIISMVIFAFLSFFFLFNFLTFKLIRSSCSTYARSLSRWMDAGHALYAEKDKRTWFQIRSWNKEIVEISRYGGRMRWCRRSSVVNVPGKWNLTLTKILKSKACFQNKLAELLDSNTNYFFSILPVQPMAVFQSPKTPCPRAKYPLI